MIIAVEQNGHLVNGLVAMSKTFKRAIDLTLTDIIGIPPGICSHKIQLMQNHKSSIHHKSRLNPPMQEVLKKKIIKWLDARVIYPIGDIG